MGEVHVHFTLNSACIDIKLNPEYLKYWQTHIYDNQLIKTKFK